MTEAAGQSEEEEESMRAAGSTEAKESEEVESMRPAGPMEQAEGMMASAAQRIVLDSGGEARYLGNVRPSPSPKRALRGSSWCCNTGERVQHFRRGLEESRMQVVEVEAEQRMQVGEEGRMEVGWDPEVRVDEGVVVPSCC